MDGRNYRMAAKVAQVMTSAGAALVTPTHMVGTMSSNTTPIPRMEREFKPSAAKRTQRTPKADAMGDYVTKDIFDAKLATAKAEAEAARAGVDAKLDYVGKEMARLSQGQDGIIRSLAVLAELPTKKDLRDWRAQWAAIAVAAVALIVGGIIGGLAWIKPDAPAAPQAQPFIVQVPGPATAPAK